MITLLWGLLRDAPLRAVHRELRRLGAPVRLLDQRAVLGTAVDVELDERPSGWLRVGGEELDLAAVGAAYLRPHDTARIVAQRGFRAGSPEQDHAAAVDQALSAWADVAPGYVVNRPAAQSSNGSKPYQLRRVAAAGFLVPPTLVTTEPSAAWAFVEEHGDVVVKSTSSVRSRVRRIGSADLARLADVRTCPTQLQRQVPGTDVRVHVVGADLFATEVSCDADDYRYAADQGCAPASLRAVDLPDEVADRCRAVSAALRLPVAGVDLRRTADGAWYCLEVNPSPAFSYYEAGTGQRIAAAIAALLAAATLCAAPPAPAAPARRPDRPPTHAPRERVAVR